MPQTYTSYHTNIKLCFSLGIEKQIFPETYLEKIPRSTSVYWKNKDTAHYSGTEFEEVAQCTLEDLKIIADMRLQKSRQLFLSFGRLYLSIINLFGEKKFQNFIKTNYRILTPFIAKFIEISENKSVVLKFLKISSNQFGQWQKMKKYECKESLIWMCYKRVSRQISQKEIHIMKLLLADKKYLHWSSGSVWGKGVKDGKISMSRQSWYHYAKLLGFGLKRKKFYQKRKRISIRAEKPNEIWHMDVTRYKTTDNKMMFIYTLMDNFSRKVLDWDVSEKLSGAIRLKSLKRAIDEQFLQKKDLKIDTQKLDLIVDGGSENNNITIHEFIIDCKVGIHKKVALKDVLFSNSLIEGNNRILKQTFLKQNKVVSFELKNHVDKSYLEYNGVKPHYFHKIYTPDEIYENPKLKDTKIFFAKLNKERIATNKNFVCSKGCP
ncbi:DDE-type integrase/transposase/recombinase [Halpernia frigidisoli]|nr:DDE-type integrase/transposase/recombinase [Halpernia frigidisoli]